MFDHTDSVVGLWPGEGPEQAADWLAREDDLAYEVACLDLADGWSASDRHFLPDGLEEIPPGPFLAVIVDSVDATKLNGHDAVRLMQTRARLAAHDEAGKLVAVAEVAYSPPGNADSSVERSPDAIEYAAVEVAAGLTLTRRAAESVLNQALSLSDRLHRVRDALSEGVLDLPRARVFDQLLGHLPEETVDIVLGRVLGEAAGLTTGQLRARLARVVLEADPDGSKVSFEEGLADRKVTVYPNPDHTGSLLISNADPKDLAEARTHIEHLARSLKTCDEPRTLDQLRVDVALDLLRGRCACDNPEYRVGDKGGVNITVPAATLAGLSDQPGDLGGFGPVFAEIARKTVRENVDGKWRFLVTDNGQPVATGTLARRPTASQQRQVRAGYRRCVMVGCRYDAWECDLDHRRPAACGGPTHNDNLGPLCRHHHMTRHHGGWQLERLDNGDHQWTSPLGHTYIQKRGPPD